MAQYCIQTIVFQLLFLLAYELFYKKDTFFTVNRIYLLCGSILSLILPLVQFNTIQKTIPDDYIINVPAVFIGENLVNNPTVQVTEIGLTNTFSINWWLTIYGIGVFVMVFLLIKKLLSIRSLHKASIKKNIHGYPIRILLDSNDAFTFWNTIYIGDHLSETEKKQVLLHEITHLQQKHSLDLIWFEILKTIFWFNPMLYVYYAKMITLHEYISDASAIKLLGKQLYYEQLLNTNFQTNDIKFVNNFFNKKLLKKRIIMLQKTKSKAQAKLKYLTIIPLLMIMLISVAFSQKVMAFTTIPSEKITEEIQQNIRYQDMTKKEAVLLENLSSTENNTVEKGYYLISNIFRHKNYFDKGIKRLEEQGLQPKSFLNPKDTYHYVYLEKYDSLKEAKAMLNSDFNNQYDGDLYILKIE